MHSPSRKQPTVFAKKSRISFLSVVFLVLPLLVHGAFVSLHITVLGPYDEHFAQASGIQPDGWQDETNDDASNAELEANGLGSAKLNKADADIFGQAVSAYMTMDLNTYDTLQVVVTGVDSGTDYIVSLRMQGGSTVRLSTANSGAGVFDYDVKALTGWSGVQTFAVVLTVESATNGIGTRFDEIKIYDSSEPPVYMEHFEEAAGQPGGWWDETNDSGNDAELDGNGLDSAHVTNVGSAGWGKVLSDSMTVDVDTYGYLSAMVTAVDSTASYKITVKLNGSDTLYELYAGNETGRFFLDIKNATGWSGSQTFSIVLVVESTTTGIGAHFDEIKIDRIAF